ncbi:hypothetical protein B5V03_23605 [Bradyrhizobium betae]|uniref:Uncharacterized protein n=1 Tax=Bradyrhizobium betae TaxID=244734 RepID=A0A4Q1UY26_9BRAD|nr:hypothetical protein B5V03_23605 [Bradyrhizobium betae]
MASEGRFWRRERGLRTSPYVQDVSRSTVWPLIGAEVGSSEDIANFWTVVGSLNNCGISDADWVYFRLFTMKMAR